MTQRIRICGPNDFIPGYPILNVTSKGSWKEFSPMLMGPVSLYKDLIAQNVENAWQFSKVYAEHDWRGYPSLEWYAWSRKGFHDSWAHRYPMGKGRKPLYSFWDGNKLGYIEARKEIYTPLYEKAINSTAYLHILQEIEELLKTNDYLYLWDYDGYDNVKKGIALQDVVECDKYKMGHAFVLANLLNKEIG